VKVGNSSKELSLCHEFLHIVIHGRRIAVTPDTPISRTTKFRHPEQIMTPETWIEDYRRQRRQIVAANAGYTAISVIALLPEAPEGVWSVVSNTLGSFASPTEFLSHLFCELVGPGHQAIEEPPLTLDGFLGSAFCEQDPWLLVPAVSLWIRRVEDVQGTVDDLFRIVALWEGLLASPITISPSRILPASELHAFLPYGRVPRKSLADAFERAVRSHLSQRARSEHRI
jgi:hypothetical protein